MKLLPRHRGDEQKPPAGGNLQARRGDALAAVDGRQLEQMAKTAIAAVDGEKSARKCTYMDLVPADYQRAVQRMAKDAHPTKGGRQSLGDFTDVMAREWLVKKDMFHRIGDSMGLTRRERIGDSANVGVVALTKNGSIVALSNPDEQGLRSAAYIRIAEREDTTIPPFSTVRLESDVALDEACLMEGGIGNTSRVIGILEVPNADLQRVTHVTGSIVGGMTVIEQHLTSGGGE